MKILILILLFSTLAKAQDLGTKLPRQQSNAIEILEKSIKKDCEKLKTKKDTLKLNIKINAYQKLTKHEKVSIAHFCKRQNQTLHRRGVVTDSI